MRALVKHELRNIWMMILYFIGCFGVIIFGFSSRIQRSYNDYLWYGYDYDMSYNLLGELTNIAGIYIMGIGLGLLVLLYIQFRDNKSIGVSSFIKSLPYTNGQIYSVKLGCGILSFTIPFLLGYGAILVIGQNAKEWLSVIECVSPVGAEIAMRNSLGQLILYGALIYSITLMLYVLGFWMQYVVNPNVPSLIIGVCSIMAPYFIVLTVTEYLKEIVESRVLNGTFRYLDTLQDLLLIPGHFNGVNRGYKIIVGNLNNQFYIRGLSDIDWIAGKMVIFLLLALIFILAIRVCSKSYLAENQEVFVSRKWAERILKTGVTVCSVCMGFVISLRFFDERGTQFMVMLHLTMIICGVIGYLTIRKICKIGQR